MSTPEQSSGTGLEPNVAGVLSYSLMISTFQCKTYRLPYIAEMVDKYAVAI